MNSKRQDKVKDIDNSQTSFHGCIKHIEWVVILNKWQTHCLKRKSIYPCFRVNYSGEECESADAIDDDEKIYS